MGGGFFFLRQEYWNGLPFPPLGDLHNPEIKPTSSASPAVQVDFFLPLSHLGSLNQQGYILEIHCWEFRGGPVARTPCFHCCGPGV